MMLKARASLMYQKLKFTSVRCFILVPNHVHEQKAKTREEHVFPFCMVNLNGLLQKPAHLMVF